MDMLAATLKRIPSWWWFGGVVALAVVGGAAVWFFSPDPLRGYVSVTITSAEGDVRPAFLDLPTLAENAVPFESPDKRRGLLAAVPSSNQERTAYLTYSKDEGRQVSFGNAAVRTPVSGVRGVVEVPSWSPDSSSIAFSTYNATSSEGSVNPDLWTVVRAVPSGDALVVGKGYRPHPAFGQKTFALVSGGIALLTYEDVLPELVVASPIPTPISTLFTVSPDGMRIAWINPADQSLQIFENVNDIFVPVLLRAEQVPQSFVFSPDGTHLLIVRSSDTTSTVELLDIEHDALVQVGELPGIVTLHSWIYDK